MSDQSPIPSLASANSSADRPVIGPADRRLRSRVTNGSKLLLEADGRGPWARRFRDVLAEIVSDLGGRDHLSEAQRQLARRAATISVVCEKIENMAAVGEAIDLMSYGQLTDRLGRCFQRLGIERRAREVQSLDDYLAEREYLDTEEGTS